MFTLVCHLVWGIVPKLGSVGRAVFPNFQFWTGVDLFFAISGYIITTSLLRSDPAWLGAGAEPCRRSGREFRRLAKPFWIRRVFRLLPSAWLWIALTLPLAAFFNAHGALGSLRDNADEAAAALLDVANFYYYHWFATGHLDYGSLGVYWSLSLEEQFYLIFPFLLFFLPRRWLVAGLVTAFLAQVFLNRPDGFVPNHASFLWFVRTDALILGVLLALWHGRPSYQRAEPRFLRCRWASPIVIGALVLLLATLPALSVLAAFSTGLVAIISGALVFVASYDRHYVLTPSPVQRVLVWLGSRSYSVYLIHTLGRSLTLELKLSSGIVPGSLAAGLWTALSFALILVLSELNYRFVETPFRRYGRQLASDRASRRPEVRLDAPAPALQE